MSRMAQNYMRPAQMMRGNNANSDYGQQAGTGNAYNQGGSFHIAESSAADFSDGASNGNGFDSVDASGYDMLSANSVSGGASSGAQWPYKMGLYGIPLLVFFGVIGLFFAMNPVKTRVKSGPDRYQTQSIWWVLPISAFAAVLTFIALEVLMKR